MDIGAIGVGATGAAMEATGVTVGATGVAVATGGRTVVVIGGVEDEVVGGVGVSDVGRVLITCLTTGRCEREQNREGPQLNTVPV